MPPAIHSADAMPKPVARTATQTMAWPVVVIGGGAAGLMAGLFAARGGARVLILESKRRPGTKIRISGGGRCNVLPSEATLADFVSGASAHTLRNMLSAWPLHEVRAFFEDDLGVPLKTEATGKLFPVSDRAQDVIDALVSAIARASGVLRCDARVKKLRQSNTPLGSTPTPDSAARFELELATGERLLATRVILATGGLSVPATGSDGSGFGMACALGHTLEPTYPALVPLLAQAPDLAALKGVARLATLTARSGGRVLGQVQGDFLFTHRGYSGPAVLNISRFVTAALARTTGRSQAQSPAQGQDKNQTQAPESLEVCVRFAQDSGSVDWRGALQAAAGSQLVGAFVRQHLPRRLADTLLARADVPCDLRLGELRKTERQAILTVLEALVLPISGNEGYRTAEVTAGGIGLGEVRVKTFESKKVPNLFIAGEALDVIGALGGYNFLWAWVSGRRAGQAVARQSARPDGWVAPCAQSLGAQSAA